GPGIRHLFDGEPRPCAQHGHAGIVDMTGDEHARHGGRRPGTNGSMRAEPRMIVPGLSSKRRVGVSPTPREGATTLVGETPTLLSHPQGNSDRAGRSPSIASAMRRPSFHFAMRSEREKEP